MSLAQKINDFIQKNKNFTMADLYSAFGTDYQKHSIRARVYENSKIIRKERGVYVVAGAELEALIEQGDSRVKMFDILKACIYYDFMFFDIPYMTGGQKGGNRDLSDYSMISPEEFKELILNAQKMLRTEDSQLYFMIADGKSSQRAAQKYIDCFDATDLKVNDYGSYTKLTKSGKVCNMGLFDMPAEKIIAYSASGKRREMDDEVNYQMDFRLERPALPKAGGYRTQKPLEMLKQMIAQTTKKGEWILDMFAGSGVSVEASLELGRKAHAIELEISAIENFIMPRVQRFADMFLQEQKSKKEYPTFDFGMVA